jgi:signal-transduction protein with cAMP-binding, CBS, and nucleotidyltransferase domain
LLQVVKREFDQKSDFIRQHPHFRTWQGKYLKQLTMALEKEIYSYEHVITKQATPVDAIYFIIS